MEDEDIEYCSVCGEEVKEEDQDYSLLELRSGTLIFHSGCCDTMKYEQIRVENMFN